MLLATAGTAALVMVVVTSVRAARRRLRYESWHLLHLYAYLGVGLALPHQIWTGTDFVSSPAARAYWWTLYAAALGAVLVYRLGPAARAHPAAPGASSRGSSRRRPASSRCTCAAASWTGCRRKAGQFFVWRFLDGPGWSRGHPYSLSAAAAPQDAAHHREGPRRRQPAAGRRCGRAPGCCSRARTAR